MPHVRLRLYAGKTEEQKQKLAELLTAAVMDGAGSAESAVSVTIEDVAPADWVEKVYKPDIMGAVGKLYKKPGYDPFNQKE